MLNNVCKTDTILLPICMGTRFVMKRILAPIQMGINEINNFYLIENIECVES
ncbi:MAG: hypothetical protein HW406_1854 [Candidatus Brocadiaceae bacterium]|nr:hypothetical protein [Candidatus Brocadiaceae bacterium]